MPSLLVTGANRGLGLEFVRQYAAEGWQVTACCREPDKADSLRRIEGDVELKVLDIADDSQIDRLAGRLDGRPIDLLINNAGIYGPDTGSGTETWLDVLRVNCIGPTHLAERLAANVARSQRRLMVALTSGMASIGDNDDGGYPIYRTSKAALNMAMKTLAVELRPKRVAVAVVSPGWVRTDMGGPHAPLTPAESVGSMRRLFEGLGLDDSGKFFDRNGKMIPW